MKYDGEMGSCAMVYIQGFINTGFGILKLNGEDTRSNNNSRT
jgi:hypothetical protein